MGEHQELRPAVFGLDSGEGTLDALHQFVMALVSERPTIMAEVTGPLLFDLCSREPFPLAGIALGEVGFHHNRADADLRTDDLRGLERPNER